MTPSEYRKLWERICADQNILCNPPPKPQPAPIQWTDQDRSFLAWLNISV